MRVAAKAAYERAARRTIFTWHRCDCFSISEVIEAELGCKKGEGPVHLFGQILVGVRSRSTRTADCSRAAILSAAQAAVRAMICSSSGPGDPSGKDPVTPPTAERPERQHTIIIYGKEPVKR
jgi:hypothetical protein